MSKATYSGWGTSTSSATSYYYTSEPAAPQHATILKVKQSGTTWADVLKASWHGITFEIGQMVSVKTMHEKIGEIVALNPVDATILFDGFDQGIPVEYSNLRRVSDQQASKFTLNPNAAFKLKKKKGPY